MNCTFKLCTHYGHCEIGNAIECKKFQHFTERHNPLESHIICVEDADEKRGLNLMKDEKVKWISVEHGHSIINLGGETMDIREVFS